MIFRDRSRFVTTEQMAVSCGRRTRSSIVIIAACDIGPDGDQLSWTIRPIARRSGSKRRSSSKPLRRSLRHGA